MKSFISSTKNYYNCNIIRDMIIISHLKGKKWPVM